MKCYRKLWESVYGPIPKDENGRSYEIHHIDGNHSNNSLDNLKLVTIEEHYDIHFQQKDYGACWSIATRMNIPVEVSKKMQSVLSKQLAKERIDAGTHNFSSELSKATQERRIKEGTHNFQGKQGSLNAIQRNKKLVELGKHPWAGEKGSEHNSKVAKERVKSGTHNFQLQPSPSLTIITCPHCNKAGSMPAMLRWHFDKCKERK